MSLSSWKFVFIWLSRMGLQYNTSNWANAHENGKRGYNFTFFRATTLLCLNSLVNPLIFFLSNSILRNEGKKVVTQSLFAFLMFGWSIAIVAYGQRKMYLVSILVMLFNLSPHKRNRHNYVYSANVVIN